MTGTEYMMQTVVFAMAAGVICQLFSEKLKVPSIFFLLTVGVLLGPHFAGYIRPEAIGFGLSTTIELGVAIILFEGGLHLIPTQLKTMTKPIRRVLTVGALITFVGATVAAATIVDLPWRYSFIFGALMIVTGPTVIGPILKRVPLVQRVATLLHWESILLDSIGAVSAILILEFVLAEESSLWLTFLQFFKILLVGVVVGLACGWIMRFFLKWGSSVSKETINLVILGGALLSFQSAHLFVAHAGLISVVVAGMVLAHGPFQQREEITEFKATLTTLIVGFLFILLAAQLDIKAVFDVGYNEWIFLGVMILCIRPLSIFVSLAGTQMRKREKFFLSLMAPRGIVAASTASLATLIFINTGHTDAHQLENLAYLVIASTVVLQGLPAGLLARLFRVIQAERTGVLIVGAHPLGRYIGQWLRQAGIEVELVDTNFWNVRAALREGFEAYHGNALDTGFLENTQIQRIGTMLTLTPNDEVNILVCQLGNRLFGDNSAYQVMPHFSQQAHVISQDLGGKPILPRIPYLDELNGGIDHGEYDWRQMTVPKGTEYTGPIELDGGLFWPLFLAKIPPTSIVPYEYIFKTDEETVGIFKLPSTPTSEL